MNKNAWLSRWLMSCMVCLLVLATLERVAAAERPSDAFSAPALIQPPREGWRTNGGSYYNQRFSPLTAIDRSNVAQLKGVWRTHLNGSGVGPQYSGAAQPIVHEGRIFIVTGANDVFALDVATGSIAWTYAAKLDPAISTVCCGWTNRGAGLGDGKLFFGALDGRLVALDEKTGKEVWSVQAERWQDGYSITSAPLYYDGMVITGFAGAEFGVRGKVKAFDARNGKPLWTFHTIPGPGEIGHDTWPANSNAWQKGGGTVWQTPAVDPSLGLIYFSTGNPGPDFNGAVRPGDNLFSASIVAIEARTGKYRWHFQQVHHDIWDYDAPSPVVLFDATVDGVPRKGLAQVGKTGWAYILDRVTGKPLIGIDERPVPQEPRQATAATQPYPRGDAIVPQHVDIAPEGYELVNGGRIFTPFFGAKGVIASPSLFGGANWPPSSYDPARHQLFVCASDVPGNFTGGHTDNEPTPVGKEYLGGAVGFAALPRSGIFAALDVRTNKLVWRQRWLDQCYSGSVATASGLVFVGRNDGRLTALDSDNGRMLWQFQTGAGMNSTASVFESGGKQYVVAYSAGNVLAGTAKGDSVWLFGLDGTLPPAKERDTEARPVAPPVAAAASSTSGPVSGAQIYQQACLPCHGADGKGGHGGGAPLNKTTEIALVVKTVTEGKNNMPPFGAALSAEQIQAVSTFVTGELFK
ncbi:MAG: PQQ-binding-like beta-propeller repeat protein [Proteobacteria bacterium]|jgi:quinohemoprotein ethanol dehydrogenase|nr:PQQ-binding-like beta-propeller repeat protein [Pseudomonadota bacterium]MBK7116060.1 PQQ-binding-like beta-propeller repeat protein [Pseudomonadota bacterium]MBK9251663.1 PQQ-binding-like beta-propeller repeat protein [Pseudomonadota bacterium]